MRSAKRIVQPPALRPTVFLDFDDVIVVSQRYGGRSVIASNPPDELWAVLFHTPAVSTLQAIVDEFDPRFVLTTSWLQHMERRGFEGLFDKCAIKFVADHLHDAWEAPTLRGKTRKDAIERWLAANHRGEPFVVLDDISSGTGLAGSRLEAAGRVVLCKTNEGLHRGHLPKVRQALCWPAA